MPIVERAIGGGLCKDKSQIWQIFQALIHQHGRQLSKLWGSSILGGKLAFFVASIK